MPMLYRTNLYMCVLFLSIVYRLTNAQELNTLMATDSSSETMISTSTPSTPPVTISTVNLSTTPAIDKSTTTVNILISTISTTSTPQINTSTVDNVRPPDTPSGPGWWLLVALLITIVFVIIGGVIFYYRQQSPYRRFLQNWRSRDDDTDNIILQLEQPEITNGQWPPRISFT